MDTTIALVGPPRSYKTLFARTLFKQRTSADAYKTTPMPTLFRAVASIQVGEDTRENALVTLIEISDVCDPLAAKHMLDKADAILVFVDSSKPHFEKALQLRIDLLETDKPIIIIDSSKSLGPSWPDGISAIRQIKDVIPLPQPSDDLRNFSFPIEVALEHVHQQKIITILSFTTLVAIRQTRFDTMLQVKLLSPHATPPTRATEGAVGYDLFAARNASVNPREHTLIPTDISIATPPGTYGRIAPRSGLALKHGIHTMAGVIDSDYRGNVGVILYNHTDNVFAVKTGDRIAQLILERAETPAVVVVDELTETARAAGGFGSTGTQ